MQPLGVGDVAREGLLVRDRDPLGRELERAAGRCRGRGRAARGRPCRAASAARSSSLERRDVADRLDPEPDEALLGPRPDAGQQPDRERREERRFAAGPDDRQPARLAAVGCDLRDDLRGRDAERAREPGAGAHDGLDRLGERPRVVEHRRHLAEVEVALVDPRLLDRRARSRGSSTRPRASSPGRASGAAGRRRRAGSAGAPRRPTSPSGCRSHAPRSCGRDDAAAVRVAADDQGHAAGARAARAPRPRRRTRRGRDARRSWSGQGTARTGSSR